jgi:hypothetical protein
MVMLMLSVVILLADLTSTRALPKRQEHELVRIEVESSALPLNLAFVAVGTQTNIALATAPKQFMDSVVGHAPTAIVADLSKGPVRLTSREKGVWLSLTVSSSSGVITASAQALRVSGFEGGVKVEGVTP